MAANWPARGHLRVAVVQQEDHLEVAHHQEHPLAAPDRALLGDCRHVRRLKLELEQPEQNRRPRRVGLTDALWRARELVGAAAAEEDELFGVDLVLMPLPEDSGRVHSKDWRVEH